MNAGFLWAGFPPEDPPPSTEYKWTLIRNYRSELLTKSDWTQIGDAPLSADEKNTWTQYRQLLRDIPQDYQDPDLVDFPEVPQWQTQPAS